MKVSELITKLQEMPQESYVVLQESEISNGGIIGEVRLLKGVKIKLNNGTGTEPETQIVSLIKKNYPK